MKNHNNDAVSKQNLIHMDNIPKYLLFYSNIRRTYFILNWLYYAAVHIIYIYVTCCYSADIIIQLFLNIGYRDKRIILLGIIPTTYTNFNHIFPLLKTKSRFVVDANIFLKCFLRLSIALIIIFAFYKKKQKQNTWCYSTAKYLTKVEFFKFGVFILQFFFYYLENIKNL